MSKIGMKSRGVRLVTGALALGLAWVGGLASATAADAQSSPEDRARFVSITRTLETAPLRPEAKADRAWALAWLTNAPDVSVNACLTTLGDMEKDYPYGGEVLVQYVFEMGVLVLEHPEAASDANAQQLDGVEGALKVYRAILAAKPKARSPGLDALLDAQGQGQLPDVTRKNWASCQAKT